MPNIFENQGITDFSEEEIREQFNIPSHIVDVDKYAFDSVERENVNFYMTEGMSEGAARTAAKRNRKDAERKAKLGAEMYRGKK